MYQSASFGNHFNIFYYFNMSVIRKEGPLMTELRSFINKRSEKKNISFIIGINVLNVLYLIISLGCTFDLRGKTQGSSDSPQPVFPLRPPFLLPPRNGHCVVLECVRICCANSYDLIGWNCIINYKNWCFLNLEFLKSQTRYAQTVRFLNEILQFENNTIFPPLSLCMLHLWV